MSLCLNSQITEDSLYHCIMDPTVNDITVVYDITTRTLIFSTQGDHEGLWSSASDAKH